MNQILKLVLFIACLSQAVRANYSIYPTDELFSSVAKRDLSNGIELNLNGAVYAAEFYEKRDRVPVSLMNDDEGNSINFLMDGSHEFYYDGENNAAITVSTHRHPESAEEKRTVRANIYLPDSNEIILVEPDENDSSFSRVSRRSLNKREFEFFDSRNFSDAGPFEKRQTKRSSGVAKNFVELIMVADYPYYTSLIEQLGTKNDEKISTYVEAYFSQLAFLAEMCYERSLRNEQLKIKIVPIEFIILKTSQSSSFTTSSEAQALFEGKSKNGINQAYTNSDKIIGEGNKVGLLPKWANEKLGNKKFDTLVVVTATDLCTCARNSNRAINPQVMGMAPLAGICTKNRNVFIIEGYKSNYNLESVTLAHELGHNLGLNHDGEEDECSNEEGYIMADGYRADENFLNSFSFSECSIRKLVENVYENGEFECLQNPVQPDQDVQRYGQFFPGQVYNLTEQCLLTIDENALTIPK